MTVRIVITVTLWVVLGAVGAAYIAWPLVAQGAGVAFLLISAVLLTGIVWKRGT